MQSADREPVAVEILENKSASDSPRSTVTWAPLMVKKPADGLVFVPRLARETPLTSAVVASAEPTLAAPSSRAVVAGAITLKM